MGVGLGLLALACATLGSGPARAEESPSTQHPVAKSPPLPHPAAPGVAAEQTAGEAAVEEPASLPKAGRISGTRVNVRVGPRLGGRAVVKLDDGDLVLVKERVGEWYGVLLPQGFRAAVALDFVEVESRDVLRVRVRQLNLRLDLPRADGALTAAFRDQVLRGERLTLLERVPGTKPDGSNGWAWVIAPDRIKVYVHSRYVTPVEEGESIETQLAAAHARRADWSRSVAEQRIEARIERADAGLRRALGTAQVGLHRLRMKAGWDRHPVVALTNELDAVLGASELAPVALRRVAQALREDLEGEVAIRLARHDAAVAKARGLATDPEKLPAPAVSQVTLRGLLRWESVPAWRTGGAWILWIDEQPTHVVRLTTGMPLPHPKLKDHADGKPRTVVGAQPGERLFGLPVIDMTSIAP